MGEELVVSSHLPERARVAVVCDPARSRAPGRQKATVKWDVWWRKGAGPWQVGGASDQRGQKIKYYLHSLAHPSGLALSSLMGLQRLLLLSKTTRRNQRILRPRDQREAGVAVVPSETEVSLRCGMPCSGSGVLGYDCVLASRPSPWVTWKLFFHLYNHPWVN